MVIIILLTCVLVRILTPVVPAGVMSSPTVLLNNLVKEDDSSSYIDPISKTYIVAEVALGLNRLFLLPKLKPVFILLASAYSLFLFGTIFYFTFFTTSDFIYVVCMDIDSIQYIFSIVLSCIVRKRLQIYYKKLQEFDMTVGCRPKRSASSVKNVIQTFVEISLLSLTIPYNWFMIGNKTISIQQLALQFFPVVQIHFIGHLLSLLVSRLRLINYYMKISLSERKEVVAPNVEDLTFKRDTLKTQNCQIKKLMDLYSVIIRAYDILIDAIKWQFVTVLTSTFISILSFSYIASLVVIRGTRPFINVAAEFAFSTIRLFPLFAPCMFSDQIREEVRCLRELLTSRLYENQLSKPGRSVARALLALTEARDLSFSLLQIFDIDISLPFKLMGLLLTYLIILLQFEKVINP